MKDKTTIENSQYILKAIHELLDDRLPKRHVGEQGPELMPVQEGTIAWAARERAKEEAGEPVEPGDLRAGDRVAFTYRGERITCALVGHQDGDVLCSDVPDSTGYAPDVVYCREWANVISDVRLIERAPREDDPDADSDERIRVYVEMVERAERRVDELEPALARSETERDEWKAKHAALRAAVQVMLAHAEPDSWEDLRLRRILDRDAARTPQANPDTVTLRRDDAETLLRFWEIAGGNGVVRDTTRRVRAALGWGDGDDA